MLAALTEALELHGLGSSVGLLPAESFPRHGGGIGIIVGFPAASAPPCARPPPGC
jgi:hypothetical protein